MTPLPARGTPTLDSKTVCRIVPNFVPSAELYRLVSSEGVEWEPRVFTGESHSIQIQLSCWFFVRRVLRSVRSGVRISPGAPDISIPFSQFKRFFPAGISAFYGCVQICYPSKRWRSLSGGSRSLAALSHSMQIPISYWLSWDESSRRLTDAVGGHLARGWGALLRLLRLPRLGYQARLFVHLDPLLA
jgi:hypothetical protein